MVIIKNWEDPLCKAEERSVSSIVDRIDRQIVHCLKLSPRASFHRISTVVGTSEQTAARRYRALVAAGAIRVVGVATPGRGAVRTWFARILCRPGAASALAQAIAAREEVSWVSLTSGGSEVFCAITDYGSLEGGPVLLDRLPRTAQVLRFTAFATLHVHAGARSEWFGLEDPLDDEQVSVLLDGRTGADPATPIGGTVAEPGDPLFDLLARDGRATVATLAAELGQSPVRVSGRLRELLRSGAVTIEVELAPRSFGFTTSAFLLLRIAPDHLHRAGQALSIHPLTGFTAAVTGRANLLTAVTCRDTEDLYGLLTTDTATLPGVTDVDVVPVHRRVKQARTRLAHGRLVSDTV